MPVSGYLFDQTNNWDAVFILFAAHYIGGALLWGMLVSDQPLVNAAKIPTDGESVI